MMKVNIKLKPKDDCAVGDFSEILPKDPPYPYMQMAIKRKPKITDFNCIQVPIKAMEINARTVTFEKVRYSDGYDTFDVWKRVS